MLYLDMLRKWGQVYNITSVRKAEDVVETHLLDSLALINPLRRYLESKDLVIEQELRMLDVGSGAGLPGVVLAVCMPELHVTCVDAVAKKAAFVQQVAWSLKAANIESRHSRVENLSGMYPLITSRAFASLADFTRLTSELLAPAGAWVAMKGRLPPEEMADLPPQVHVFHVEPLQIPGKDIQRCLVWMEHMADGRSENC